MLKALNDKLRLMRGTREKCEELAMTMEFLDGGAIKRLKGFLKNYYDDHENDTYRTNVDNEVIRLIDVADKNMKEEDLLGNGPATGQDKNEEEKKQGDDDSSSQQYGHLVWLHKLIDLSQSQNKDIYRHLAVNDNDSLFEGAIIDAQDYLGAWHMAVICKVQPNNENEFIKVNLFPYPKGNRDEWISVGEISDRISGPFVNSESVKVYEVEQVNKCLLSLREYYAKFTSQN